MANANQRRDITRWLWVPPDASDPLTRPDLTLPSRRNRAVSCQLIRRVSLRPWAENQGPPPTRAPAPEAPAGPAEGFQFTPKNRPRPGIAALGLQHLLGPSEIPK